MSISFLEIFRSDDRDDPLASLRSVNAWAANLPAAEFAPGKNLSTSIFGVTHDIRLLEALEQNEDWVCAAHEVPDQAINA